MREFAVGVSHLVRVFALLHCAAAVVRSIHEFAAKAIDHGGFVALAGSNDQPANSESLTTLGTNINRNLVSCTTNATRTNFDVRSDVVESRMENRDRLLLQLCLNGIEGTINDAFSNRLLTMKHDSVHELGDDQITKLRIGIDLALFCTVTT